MTSPTQSSPDIRGKRDRRSARPGPSRSLDDMDLRFSFSLPGKGWRCKVIRRARFTMGTDIPDPPPLKVRIELASHFSDFLEAEYYGEATARPARGTGAVSEGIAGGRMIVIRLPQHRCFSTSHWHSGTSVADDARRLD